MLDKRIALLIVLSLALAPKLCLADGTEKSEEMDWEKIEQLVAKLQSATAKKDEMHVVKEGIELLNVLPSSQKHLSVGYTVGEDGGLYYNMASHLTGKTYRLRLNPFRKFQPECLYIRGFYGGAVVLYTGKEEMIRTCKGDESILAGPEGWWPVRSANQMVQLRLDPRKRLLGATNIDTIRAAMAGGAMPFAVDPAGIMDRKQLEGVTFLAGRVVVDERGMRTFDVRYARTFGEKPEKDLLTLNMWERCLECQGEHPNDIAQDFC